MCVRARVRACVRVYVCIFSLFGSIIFCRVTKQLIPKRRPFGFVFESGLEGRSLEGRSLERRSREGRSLEGRSLERRSREAGGQNNTLRRPHSVVSGLSGRWRRCLWSLSGRWKLSLVSHWSLSVRWRRFLVSLWMVVSPVSLWTGHWFLWSLSLDGGGGVSGLS